MLSLPIASKAVTPAGKRPALISVMEGTPLLDSLSSTENAPDGCCSIARTARRLASSASVATTVFAKHDKENTPLGLFPAAK